MNPIEFACLGRRIILFTHPAPDHLAGVISQTRMFYEMDVLLKCREIYLPGTTILDIGANIGNHSVFFGAVLEARVEAFEPFPGNQELLECNVIANGLTERVRIHCCAVGESAGSGTIHAPREANNLGTVQIAPGAGDVPIVRLDDMDPPGPVGLLKIDVEGAEPMVLRGAARLIAAWLPDIMIEAGTAAEFAAVAEILLEYGYTPKSRHAWTATYLFTAADQVSRMERVLAAL